MANEIQGHATAGWTLYAVLMNSAGQIWNGTAFVTIVPANWTDYDIALTEATAGIYLGSMPAVAAGTYSFVVYRRLGGVPAITDTQVDENTIAWNGSAVAAPAGTGYASTTQMRAYLTQVPAGATVDALLQECLDRATKIIDGELTFSFAAYGATATNKDFYRAKASQYLDLPQYSAGSITHIYLLYAKGTTSESTEEVLSTDYDITDGGRLYRYTGWRAGWFRVTTIWGYGPAPDDIVEVCLELAINLWLGSQGGQFSDVVGIEGGGAVGYNREFTRRQKKILTDTKTRYGEYGFA